MKFKRIISLIIAIALLFALLTACKKPVTSAAPPSAQPVAHTTIFEASKLPLPLDTLVLKDAAADPPRRQIYAYANGRVYVERYTDITDNGEIVGQLMELISVNLDGKDMRDAWSHEVLFSDKTAQVQTFESLRLFNVDDDGNPWVLLQYETQDNTDELAPVTSTDYKMLKYNTDGELVGSTLISAVVEKPELPALSGIVFDNDGNAYLELVDMSEETYTLHVFSAETAELMCAGRTTEYNKMLFHTPDGNVGYSYVEGNALMFAVCRLSDGAITETMHKYEGVQNFIQVADGYGEFDVVFYDFIEDGLYSYDFETGTDVLIIDLIASAISMPRFSESPGTGGYLTPGSFVALSETEFLLSQNPFGVFRLKPSNAPSEKVIITIGVTLDDTTMSRAVSEFNRQSDTIQAVVKLYPGGVSETFDRTVPAAQLDLDIINGEGPDIISFLDIAPEKYINKGLLADMMPYLDNDPNISREDLFENILNLGVTGGKLYYINTTFMPMGFVGKKSIFGDGDMTMEKITSALADYPDARLIEYPARDWIKDCTQFVMGDFLDWETGTCDFDNPDFIALLNTAKRIDFNADFTFMSDAELFSQKYDTFVSDVASNNLLLGMGQLFDLRCARTAAETFGDDWAFYGFPSKNGGNQLTPKNSYGILETSAYKDEAWELISALLHDAEGAATSNAIPINRAAFEQMASEEIMPIVDRFARVGTYVKTSFGIYSHYDTISTLEEAREPKWENYHLTDAEVNIVREGIESIKATASSDAQVLKIVMEEADVFLGGSRTAEETAKIIQSRVGIYVAENS